MFDIASFIRLLQTGWLGRRFWHFRKLDSTNRHLQDIPGRRLSHGLVCIADEQTGGKGQFGRSWFSAPNENLTFTIVLKPSSNSGLQLFSMAVMLALCKTVRTMVNGECNIKWPNDLQIAGKKAAGLLTECRYNGKHLDRMFLGLGINVNQVRFPDAIRDKATSLVRHTNGQTVDRSLLLAVFLNRLEPYIYQVEDGDMDLIRSINRNIQGYGRWVSILVDGKREETPVKILGINEFGFLMVLTANDDIKTFKHEQVRIESPPSDS